MSTIFRCLGIVILLLFTQSGAAQTGEEPIKWQVTVKMTSEKEGIATFKAIISSGWHLYGMKIPEQGPKPTVIDVSQSKGVTFIGDFVPDRAPVRIHDKMFDIDLTWWDSDIAIRRKFKVEDSKSAVISGKITYMGCNDMTCSPPQTYTFSKTLPPFKSK